MSAHEFDSLEFSDLVIDQAPGDADDDTDDDDGYYPMLISAE